MKRKKKNMLPAKYILSIMIILCVILIGCSISMKSNPVNSGLGSVVIPMQKGVNKIGGALYNFREHMLSKDALIKENEELRLALSQTQEELNTLKVDEKKLEELKKLYDVDQAFSDYDKLAASVISKETGNWFSTFIIDKGTNNGVTEGMNIIADGGLAGIVIEAGPGYAKVRSIIDDDSNVSSMILSTSDLCIVRGNLKTVNQSSLIEFSNLQDENEAVIAGDEIITSNVSDLFLPGIPIGYIVELNADSNNLTKSGKIAPIVDFKHLSNVFVIMGVKDIDSSEVLNNPVPTDEEDAPAGSAETENKTEGTEDNTHEETPAEETAGDGHELRDGTVGE